MVISQSHAPPLSPFGTSPPVGPGMHIVSVWNIAQDFVLTILEAFIVFVSMFRIVRT